jgi:hypothetical protein
MGRPEKLILWPFCQFFLFLTHSIEKVSKSKETVATTVVIVVVMMMMMM